MSQQLQYHPNYIREEISAGRPLNKALQFFLRDIRPQMRVLEIGTRRWFDQPTHHKDLFPSPQEYWMMDESPGVDVDICGDIHCMPFSSEFDAVWCSSVFEHLHSPKVAAEKILEALKPGGIFFIQTHQTFPIHGFPRDFCRFTTEALTEMFSQAQITMASYDFPCKIMPLIPVPNWNDGAESFLNVCIAGIKGRNR